MAPFNLMAVSLLGCLSSLALGAPTATTNFGKRASVDDVSINARIVQAPSGQHPNVALT
jgi:hypothetical protein